MNYLRKLFGKYLISRRHLAKTDSLVISFKGPEKRKAIYDKVLQNVKEGRSLLRNEERYNVYSLTERTHKIAGDIAEVGVYMGGSAKMILQAESEKVVWLFDTFTGLPATSNRDMPNFYQGRFAWRADSVEDYLAEFDNFRIMEGFFPDTGKEIENKRFSFVHFDVDLYQSTLDCFRFFYPRMTPGGVMLSHDYIKAKGVREAIDEFFSDKPEAVLETFGNQALIVKI